MASSMVSWSEQNLSCPICLEIFQDPVILQCSHSFCAGCWQQFKTGKTIINCPVCKTQSLLYDPPRNLALKNICEDFLKEKTEQLSTGIEALCSLHSEKLKLFCLDHQQPVCVICLHSDSHNNHYIRPIDESAHDYKEELRVLLKPRQEKLELLNDVKGNFDQTAQNIEVQAQDAERQIKDTFLMLQRFLQEEEQTRTDAVRKEKNQKIRMMKSKSEALSREIAALSNTVRATEEVLQADSFSFLQRYKTAAEIIQHSPEDAPQLIPEDLIDMTRHLNNLSYNILDSMKTKLTSTLNPQTAVPKPRVGLFGSNFHPPTGRCEYVQHTTPAISQPQPLITPAQQVTPTVTPAHQVTPTALPAFQLQPLIRPTSALNPQTAVPPPRVSIFGLYFNPSTGRCEYVQNTTPAISRPQAQPLTRPT